MNDTQALDDALAGLLQALQGDVLQQCTQAAAAPLLQQAQQRVPVASGLVRNHLAAVSHHSANSASTAVQVLDSGPGGAAHAAIFVEYGTAHMPAQPFMRTAFAAAHDQALAAFTAALQARLGS